MLVWGDRDEHISYLTDDCRRSESLTGGRTALEALLMAERLRHWADQIDLALNHAHAPLTADRIYDALADAPVDDIITVSTARQLATHLFARLGGTS